MIVFIYLPKNIILNKQNVMVLIYVLTLINILLCIQFIFKYVVSNMLFDRDKPINTLLQIQVNFNNGNTIYIISFRLNISILIFILKKFLMKYHDKVSITLF